MDLLTRLNRAMDYIEDNICEDINFEEIAKIAQTTAYQFQRMFCYIADVPLSEYIRRRKMSLAANELQDSEIKIIDIAIKYGYDSADSFSRAFNKLHGINPSQARNNGVSLTHYPKLIFHISIKGATEMNYRIEEKEAYEVFGIERIFGNDETEKVPDFWTECHQNGEYERLFDAAGGVRYPDGHGYPYEDGSCVIRAACGYSEPGENMFPYMICAVKDKTSDTIGFKVAQIPKTTWAIFRSEETEMIGLEIPKLFGRAYSEWLPSSGYDKAIGPDMEIYGIAGNGKYYEEVWLPVKKK